MLLQHPCSWGRAMKVPIIGIKRLCMDTDGEGVTTLVAFYGCTLNCNYCLNPHSKELLYPIKWYTEETLYREVKIDYLYFQATGGGLTFGGGEPLLHIDFINSMKQQYGRDICFNAETALHIEWDLIKRSTKAIDHYIVDCKSMDNEIYKRYTGRDNQRMRENLARLLEQVGNERLTVKLPIIPGYQEEGQLSYSKAELAAIGITDIRTFPYTTQIDKVKWE